MSAIRPVIVVGAARSGTKILRDSLAVAAGAGRVPYDVGYVWRYGNEECPHDRLLPDHVRPRTRRFVREFLSTYADSHGLVVEKTVGNSLRVGFVREILPEARFVYVERDGVDVAVSTRREWEAPTDWAYVAKKLRHFPPRLMAGYGRKFVKSQTLGRAQSGGHVGTWGPRYPGMDRDLIEHDLLRVCARQWKSSIVEASRDLQATGDAVVRVSYSDFVASPRLSLTRMLEELELDVAPRRLDEAAQMVDRGAASPARPKLTPSERIMLAQELGTALEERGYDQP